MLNVHIRPTLSLLRLVSSIERVIGEHSGKNPDFLASNLSENELLQSATSLINLDISLGSFDSNKNLTLSETVKNLQIAKGTNNLSRSSIDDYFRTLIDCSPSVPINYRQSPSEFNAVGNATGLFKTVAPFLIIKRLEELIDWTNEELAKGEIHPMIVCAVFHLLFLQISPYRLGNHTVSLICVWHLLNISGYTLFHYQHLAPYFENESSAYFTSIRQAEKTIYGDWSTLNLWLEFFLKVSDEALTNLKNTLDENLEHSRLTPVQKDIISTIGIHGSITRERVAQKTSINLSTVKYNLGVLTERGFIERLGAGRTTSYKVK